MLKRKGYDAIVVGSGPNGLAAAITLAQKNLSVLVVEGKDTIGGGMRTAELTLPGFLHDVCSAIHPLGIGSPFFHSLPLSQYGLEWIQPPTPLAHPFKDGRVVTLERSINATGNLLGKDKTAYQRLMEPFVENWKDLISEILAPLHFPTHPLSMARFGYYGIRSAENLVNKMFKEEMARSLFAGLAAHSVLPLNKLLTAAFGLFLGFLGHSIGWPMPKGGSQSLANSLASYFRSIGGEIVTEMMIENIDDLPYAHCIFLDVTPKQMLKIAGNHLPNDYKKRLEKYRYGSGIFKIDWALNHPIPWRSSSCSKAGTVHLGGTFEEISKSELQVWNGEIPDNNFILLCQPTLFDPSRAPHGKHIAWAYCHVPNGSILDLTKQIEQQIEQYAPGFSDCILARSVKNTKDMENYNPNYIGGDINGGLQDIYQAFTRPLARLVPYSTPVKGLYICSSSTPPGGGVHGMCGYHAAQAALKRDFRK